jgi:hypothetical protein
MGSQLTQISHNQNVILCEEDTTLTGDGIGIYVKGLGRVGHPLVLLKAHILINYWK